MPSGYVIVLETGVQDVTDPDALEGHFELLIEALEDLGAQEPSVDGSSSTGDVSISLLCQGSNPMEALTTGHSLVQAALQKAGGGARWTEPVPRRRVALR